ncbi:hypothetical protein HAT86_02750 [Roseovarius gahaiensis]|uniref:Uncharacterized protein n=1 Tax=Roseovarius gahaiensis TaxID=2716691 RepID=A0A967EFD5_9RHOB|nr:hypothetical protein [Roseovarius gahaiensis]NHQ73385.1 hypothetical protein [Roseovarius gahaiensis]
MSRKAYPETPDGRYFVSKGKLWRKTDPSLSDQERRAAIKALMQARRAGQVAQTEAEHIRAHSDVDAAKRRLGERGPVWWADGARDETGQHPANSSYAAWWSGLEAAARARGEGEPSDR